MVHDNVELNNNVCFGCGEEVTQEPGRVRGQFPPPPKTFCLNGMDMPVPPPQILAITRHINILPPPPPPKKKIVPAYLRSRTVTCPIGYSSNCQMGTTFPCALRLSEDLARRQPGGGGGGLTLKGGWVVDGSWGLGGRLSGSSIGTKEKIYIPTGGGGDP